MNAQGGKDSTNIISIPYNYADAENGFLYQGKTLEAKEYVHEMVKSYEKYKGAVNPVQNNWYSLIGTNISNNNYRKESNNYKKTSDYYEETFANIYDADGAEMTVDMLIKHFQDAKPFVIIVNMYRLGDAKHEDLLIDIAQWAREADKIMNDPYLSGIEKIKYSSRKDLRLRFTDAKSSAVLEGARLMDVINNRKFSFLIEKITFVV